MLGLREEAAAFLTAILAGMISSCGYLCLRKLRRVIGHSLAVIAIEDGLYWLCTAIYLFTQIYQTSSGSIRWYFVAGVFAGAAGVSLLDRLWRKKILRKHKKVKEKDKKVLN